MRDNGRAAAYARAIYDASLASWLRDLSSLRDNLRAESGLRVMLEDLDVPFETRKTLVDRVLPHDAGQEVRNFAYTLASQGDFAMLDAIVGELRRLQRHGPNVIVAHVTTAVPLGDAERAALEARLRATHGQDLDVEYHVDAAILGGVVVQVGDAITDDSLATRLESLRTTLKGGA